VARGITAGRARQVKDPKTCHERALGLLAVRARSRRELETRLRGAGFESDEVDDVLNRLERVGLIDDEAFARQLAEHRFGVKRAGSRSVANELLGKGVSAELVASIVGVAGESEEERADALATSRASRMASVDPAKALTRLSSLLMRRGYSPDVARNAARRALRLEVGED
jgi:regulatory protein